MLINLNFEQKLDETIMRQNKINAKIEEQLKDHDQRLNSLENKVSDLSKQVSNMSNQVSDLSNQVSDLGNQVSDLKADMKKVLKILEKLDQQKGPFLQSTSSDFL